MLKRNSKEMSILYLEDCYPLILPLFLPESLETSPANLPFFRVFLEYLEFICTSSIFVFVHF